MDRGAWQTTAHAVRQLGMTEVTEPACLHPGDHEEAVLTDAENWSPHLAGWVGGGLPLDSRVESPD